MQNDLFLRAANGELTERTPVWLMRQAGRILPEYRALREKFPDFKAFVKTPEAATEATLQPVKLLGVDAAILFSDILVVPEAMGLNYEMVEKTGPIFPKSIENAADIQQLLDATTAASNLEYVYEAMRLTRRELNGRVPLIGFAGAPWTIFAYMVEGRGSKTFSKAKKMLYTQPALSHLLLQKITDTTIIYLQKQVIAGAQLIQIFDSWAGILTPMQYAEFASPYIQQICEAVTGAPKTVFAKGAFFAFYDFSKMPCHVIGVDWNTRPHTARRLAGNKVLQGNLDPCALYADTKTIRQQTTEMLADFGQHHIANLGHGVYPDTPLDGVKAFIDTVKEYYHGEMPSL
jgi:uroporphyrinogen decarboxylase